MQEQSAEKCSSGKRLDRLRVTLQSNWADIAQKLDLSESMVYQVKSGKKELSEKAIYRLEQAEREAGIAPPLTEQVKAARSQGPAAVKQVLAGVTPQELWQTFSPEDQVKFALAIGDQIKKTIDQFIIDAEHLAQSVTTFRQTPTSQRLGNDLDLFARQVTQQAAFLKAVRGLAD